ncbi:mechanosensitive ion channel family protein [Alteromonas portus]|uniref:Small-conductance mechanosensitive channel n=1 Tax=Alteromonas portus TaxID=2565549 RepID=A0A4U0ZKE0_9ALTE|nr:mechanosensitive ion channel family protein [Alteromonas portus]TKB04163.1 mechanosensitive ion channel family protein [Alteromonas portus]
MFSAQQLLLPGFLNKRVGLSFTQTDTISSERFIQTLLQQSEDGGAISSLSSAQSLLSQLWDSFIYRLPGLALGLVIMVAFILLAPHIAKVIVKPLTRTTTSALLRSVIQRSVSLVLILLGIYLFLFLAGLTGFAIAVVSGTGVVGLILGFAFRDIAENFISSLLLTIQRPFRIGDIVQINDFTGIIQKVTARATTLVDFDGNHIQIPNATIYKGVIKNLTANPLMRGQFIIGVGYDSDIQQAQRIAQKITASQDNVLKDPEPQILIDELGSSTYNIKVYFWVDVEKTSVLKMASVLMRKITQAFLDANISMPDDARERIFPEGLNLRVEQNEATGSQRRKEESLEDKGSVSTGFSGGRETTNENNVDTTNHERSQAKGSDSPSIESNNKGKNPLGHGAAGDYSVNPKDALAQNSERKHSSNPKNTAYNESPEERLSTQDDVSSEAHEIREQARRSRDPEAGENIL